ncbi:MAG TPA: chromosome segregation protein SMC [Candidatus Obscuribacterales bacterium]
MRIREIELDNFKSFGKHTCVPILDGFTTISGPNGSGKSNIIDSLLFALGLSSTRTMRAERLPDLLNNLSGKNEAKVTVRFTNDVDKELEVSRRIRVKDNGYTSTYTLNGRVSTLSEIHDELTKYNVSPTGFNVIMQGDVTGIVTMSATERRKIIDELAGVAEFDRRIEQANEELSSVAEKIEHQKIILAEIAVRLEQLRADRDHALKYLELKSQKETVEKDLVFVRAQETEAKLNSEVEELAKIDAREKELLEKLDEAEVTLVKLRAEMGNLESEIREKGGNEQLLLRQEIENQRGDLTREENKLSNLMGVIGEKAKLIKSIQSQIKTIDKHLADIGKQRKQHLEDNQAIQLGLMEKQGAYSAVMAEIEVLRQKKDSSSEKVSALHIDLQKLRDEKHKLEVKNTELATRKEGLEKELVSLREQATESIGKLSQCKNLVGAFEKKFQDQEALTIGVERSIRQLEDELQSTREEIETKRNALESMNKRLIELETTKEVVGESGYGKAVEAIIDAQIPGVHGTIGQLGNVSDEYVTALEIAIGPRLGHIVVDDDQVAQTCIEYLKKHHAGRATFVPLNKIQVQPPGLLPQRPGVIDFAYNLIDFNPRFAKAFQYACGQTLVVENMEVGRRLINQARMVTLDGELFDKSGSISGGHDNKAKLHFSGRGETDLAVLKQTTKNLADQIRWAQESLKEIEAALQDERAKGNEARTELAQRHAELDARKKQTQELEESIESIKPRLRKSGDEIEQIDQEMTQIASQLKEVSGKITKLEQALDEVRDQGSKSEIERLIHESEELRAELEAVEKEVKEIQRLSDKLDTEERLEMNNRQGLVTQLEALTAEMAELAVQKPQFEEAISALKQSIAQKEQQVEELSQELEELRKAKESIYEKVLQCEVERSKLEQEHKHLAQQREERKLAKFDLENQLTALKEEIARLLEEHPDYEPPSQGTVDQLKHQVERLEKRMRALEPVNMKALDEYNQTDQRQRELNDHLNILTVERDEIVQRIAGYDELKRRTFMEAFDAINANFQEIFAELSHGHGRLELENPENPFAGGLIIRAQPRDKKMQRIEALSGGEKSLTALSFVFAFQRFAPAPFYAFDEVDMMLDGSNAERLARMVKRQSGSAQFVVVSLRRPMIENSDHAIGVSLRADGYSRVVGIKEVQLPEEQPMSA